MKKILGLDLGTNSIGWALVEQDFDQKQGKILGMGSRIIPMNAGDMAKFADGSATSSKTAERTFYRGKRRLYERSNLRRERLHRVLNVLEFLPEHYANNIDFEKRFGQFKSETEPKLAWRKNEKNKYEFVFQCAFEEMLEEFKTAHPDLFNRKNRKGEEVKIPYDWTIYYLRQKALKEVITREELAWLILNFNQKRGYYQLREEVEDEKMNKLIEYHSLKIVDVIADENPDNKEENWYSLYLENGWIYRRSSKISLEDWKNKVRDFIVTTDLNDDGTIKKDREGIEKRSFRSPQEDDWALLKKKTESDIENYVSGNQLEKTVGTYIYKTLLQNPTQKIRGKLIRTIERKYYKDELKAILEKQIALQPELFTDELYNACVRELYKNNEAHQMQLSKRDFVHLFLNDIIFYQRPLRSQKSNIANCSLEFRKYKQQDNNGKEIEIKEYLKVIPKSNPYYQEFRVWQWLYNLKIYVKSDNSDVTDTFLKSIEDWENLFEFLMTKEKVNHTDILNFFIEPILKEQYPNLKSNTLKTEIKKEVAKYRWNYVFDDLKEKEEEKSIFYPMNETGYEIRKRLKKVENIPADFLTREIEQQLWHIIYSVTDKNEFEKALETFAKKHDLNQDSFVENFKRIKPYDSEYGSFSEKAIKNLLPLMRIGKYWSWENIDNNTNNTKDRIDKIINGEYDEKIKDRVREKAIDLQQRSDFQGLQLWLAQYIVYDRHSEAENTDQWKTSHDIQEYLYKFKQHSLRNPLVEQIITETLRIVKDIWEYYAEKNSMSYEMVFDEHKKQKVKSYPKFFDEIHIELGRDMKNTAEERKRLTNIVTENENTNQRIKAFLVELLNDQSVENVRPYSPIQHEALKIFENGILNSGIEIPEQIKKISKSAQPTPTEFHSYKLWLEQKYRSPYTGNIIPLSKLFTPEYEIEHVIPQSLYFDDSLSNKVICESAVNKIKDNQLALEFIKNHSGEIVDLGFGKIVTIFNEEEYKNFIKEQYKNNRQKSRKLLMEEIPEEIIARQLNDTRYISKFISNLLSNIVRSDNNDDGVNSKNIIPCNGKITTRLKQDWGLNDVWNELILPRFERMNELTKTTVFTTKNKEGQTIPAIPFELSKGFQKKRIDHRHHAMDALVIACATRDHVNLLNNQSAKSDYKRYDLQYKLRNIEKWKNKNGEERDKFTAFKKPWDSFTIDAKNELENIVVSFKQNLRVINKATNYYWKYENEKKVKKKQEGINWAIRKPLHKETVSGKVNLPGIKVPKGKILTATRKCIDTSFNLKTIKSITDTGIQKILENYLKIKGSSELAFSPEGLDEMNKNISQYNDGKPHKPIYKARVFEIGSKFQVGTKGNKKEKYVEAAKGTNLFFAVYQDENTERNYATIPLNEVIERQKQGLSPIPEMNEKGHKLLFFLSPNDLVYVPTVEELENNSEIDFGNMINEQRKRIYKFTDGSGTMANFIPINIASVLFNMNKEKQKKMFKKVIFEIQNEIGIGSQGSKNENSSTGEQIKSICLKLRVDRLGNVSKI